MLGHLTPLQSLTMTAIKEWLDYTQKHYKSSVKRLKAIFMYLCVSSMASCSCFGSLILPPASTKSCLFFPFMLMHIEWCCNNLMLPPYASRGLVFITEFSVRHSVSIHARIPVYLCAICSALGTHHRWINDKCSLILWMRVRIQIRVCHIIFMYTFVFILGWVYRIFNLNDFHISQFWHWIVWAAHRSDFLGIFRLCAQSGRMASTSHLMNQITMFCFSSG